MREAFLGYSVWASDAGGCVAEIAAAIGAGRRCWLACLNPHSFAEAQKHPPLARVLKAADWLVPDGVGIVLGSRLLSGRIHQRVTGYDIFSGLSELLNRRGGATVFLLGSTESTLSEIRRRMATQWPALRIVGTYSPPFRTFTASDLDAMEAEINAVDPDVLWVAMTAPKQEEWIHEMLPRLDVRFAGAVGAVFDFYAGKIRRSAPLFQRLGLEWLPRLLQEPRRLWRRTFVSAPIFLFHLIRARFGMSGT